MDFKGHLETAWRNTFKFVGPVLLLTIGQIIVTLLSFGILAPVTTAGYMQSLLSAQREGRPPDIRDLFSHMSLFLPLFVFFVLVSLATMVGFMILILPGVAVALFTLFATMYTVPLMTDKNMAIMDALKRSWEMAKREPIIDQVVVSIIWLVLISLGSSIPLAILIIQPFAMFFLLSVYEERLNSTASETIGQSLASPPPPPEPPPPPAQ